ncbi:MAG TPA: xanthine dehydrogenase family protein molybdopterin-binding subunit, partial [Reyranella sp.]|nr:xanthine dehydrogenase family protein molybdopterin-binding subunit [Reyranella sp.]
MNAPFAADNIDSMKFAIGQPVPRNEDPTLLKGEGRYSDDVSMSNQAWCVMVRSQVAHGIIKGIDTGEARRMPGVLGIWTGADLNAAGYGPLKTVMMVPQRDGSPMKTPTRFSLATDKVRFVGDPVAFVVAETQAQAKDAAEAVVLDIESLPSITDAREAAQPGAPVVFDDVPGNVCADYHYGDTPKVDEAFAKAAHVTRLRLISNRIVVCAMEPRSAVAFYDKETDRYTFQAGNQGAFGLKNQMAALLGVKPPQVRILTGNVGGSFGMKGSPYPEYAGMFHASKLLGRPVKWTDERSGSFLSDQHGRDHDFDAELALDKDGTFLAVRLVGYANLGGYLSNVGAAMGALGVTRNLAAIYRTPLISVSTKVCFTNTSPIGAYRGAGRPEANYFMERLITTAAREMGIDEVEMRKRNHIKPEEMPYKTASGTVYDSGEFTALLDKALRLADVDGFAARREESKARGKLRGMGIGDYLEVTAPPMNEMG